MPQDDKYGLTPAGSNATAVIDDKYGLEPASQPVRVDKGTASSTTPPKEGFASSFGATLPGYHADDPLGALKDIYQGGKEMFTHPIDSASLLLHGITDPMQETATAGIRRMGQPGIANKITGGIQYLESGVPILGPMLSHAGEQFEQGDIGGGLGTTAGAALPFVASPIMKAAGTAVPATVGKAAKVIGAPFGVGLTDEELLTKGISPRASAVDFPENLTRAKNDLKAYDQSITSIKSVDDLNEAIPKIQQNIWSTEVEPALQRQAGLPVNMKPAANAVRQLITPEMAEFDSADARALSSFAGKLEASRDVASANRLLKYANGKLDAYFQKFPAARKANLLANPETAGWETARRAVRNEFLDTLEQAGETGVRGARLRWGALEDVGNEVERRVNVADRQKPMTLSRMMGLFSGLGTSTGMLASGHPIGALAGLAPPILGEIATRMNTSDALIARGIRKVPFEASSPVTAGIPIREAAATPKGLLGPGATPMGWTPEETSGSIRGGRWTTPRASLPEPAPIEAEFIPRRVPTERPTRVGVNRMLPSGELPATNIPPIPESQFMREDVNAPDERVLARGGGIRQPIRGALPAGNPTPFASIREVGAPGLRHEVQGLVKSPALEVPEWRAQEKSYELQKARDILRNLNATEEEKAVALARLKENE